MADRTFLDHLRAAGEAGRVLRFSSGWETTELDWNALAEGLVKVYQGIVKR